MRSIENLRDSSIRIIKENQSASGAYVASPTFSMYNYCYLRDGCFTAYSMDICGEHESADRFYHWFDRVISTQAAKLKRIIAMKKRGETLLNEDYLPTKYGLNGEEPMDEWPNFQLDGYGTYLWAIAQHISIAKNKDLIRNYKKSIRITVDYLLNFWGSPNFDCWQENGDRIHTTTLACIYGGLKAVNEFLKEDRIEDTAKDIKSFVLQNCTFQGRLKKSVDDENIDASLLWAAVPFRLFDVKDLIILKTVDKIESTLVHGYGVHRYPADTYYGGGEWLILSSWLGIYYCELNEVDKPTEFIKWIESCANERGELAEQSLKHVNNPDFINKWKSLWGDVASPVLWPHAMYLLLHKKIQEKVNESVLDVLKK